MEIVITSSLGIIVMLIILALTQQWLLRGEVFKSNKELIEKMSGIDKRLDKIDLHLNNHVTDTDKKISDLQKSMDKVTDWIDKQPKN